MYVQKNREAKIYSSTVDSIHSGKMEEMLLVYGFHKETIAAIIMLYKKVKIRSPDGDTDYFDIVAGVLQRDTLAPVSNGFKLAKERSKLYSVQTITDTNYAFDIALLANAPTQAESLLHSLKRESGGIDLYFNADKTEYKCFNQRGDISTLKYGLLTSKWTSSLTSKTVSHQPKKTSTRD